MRTSLGMLIACYEMNFAKRHDGIERSHANLKLKTTNQRRGFHIIII